MHLPHGLRWPFLGQIENFQMLMTFWVIMNKSQGEAISKRKKRCNSIMLVYCHLILDVVKSKIFGMVTNNQAG